MSSNFGKVGPPTTELAALERLKTPYSCTMGKMVSTFYLILLILAGNEDMHEILDEFRRRTEATTNYEASCH